MPNIPEGSYWPPRDWSTTYKFEKCNVDYMTKQEYTQLYQEGKLRDTKIHEENLIMPAVSTELRDNPQLRVLKRIEKDFKGKLEGSREDSLVFEKDI